MFIVLEGVDGSGKDTQLVKLFEWIGKRNKYAQIWKTREPSNFTQAGKEIARRLRAEGFASADEALDLYIADRKEQSPLRQAIAAHSIILSSRSDFSTYAFQGVDIDFETIWNRHEYEKNNILSPDVSFLLHLDQDVVEKKLESRISGRGEAKEFFEDIAFQKKVAQNYLKAAQFLEKKGRKIYIIDADQSIEEVFTEIHSILEKEFHF